MNNQFGGVIRAIGPIIIGYLVSLGVDSATAGLIVAAIFATISAGWSWYTNSMTHATTDVSNQQDVKVVVGPNASQSMQKLAANTSVPNVVKQT